MVLTNSAADDAVYLCVCVRAHTCEPWSVVIQCFAFFLLSSQSHHSKQDKLDLHISQTFTFQLHLICFTVLGFSVAPLRAAGERQAPGISYGICKRIYSCVKTLRPLNHSRQVALLCQTPGGSPAPAALVRYFSYSRNSKSFMFTCV